jgi:hypothetical protein
MLTGSVCFLPFLTNLKGDKIYKEEREGHTVYWCSQLHFHIPYCNILGFYSRQIFISTPKLNKLELHTISNSPNTAGQSLIVLLVHLHARTVPKRIVRH